MASVGAIVGTSVGTAAYTSAETSRDATFTVETDEDALIGLVAGTPTEITNNEDLLEIAITDMNTESTFTYGNGDSLDEEHAFSITNNDSVERSMTVEYDAEGVTFELYEEGETDWGGAASLENGTVDHETDGTWTAGAGQEVRAVMIVDTANTASGTDDLNGTLTISAESTN